MISLIPSVQTINGHRLRPPLLEGEGHKTVGFGGASSKYPPIFYHEHTYQILELLLRTLIGFAFNVSESHYQGCSIDTQEGLV